MSDSVPMLIKQLRSPSYREQSAAANQLGELADPAAEQPLLDSFWGRTYQLIDREGAPGCYYAILSSAAKALARLNTDQAFAALVTKIQSNPGMDQLGVAAAVYGLSFSPRPGIEDLIQSITPRLEKDSGHYLAEEIASAMERIMIRTAVHEGYPRCPSCQQPLRTAKAQQCFECGLDWH